MFDEAAVRRKERQDRWRAAHPNYKKEWLKKKRDYKPSRRRFEARVASLEESCARPRFERPVEEFLKHRGARLTAEQIWSNLGGDPHNFLSLGR